MVSFLTRYLLIFGFCVQGLYGFQANEKQVFDNNENWQSIFNGKNLEGWSPKIRGFELGDDPFNTFRVNAQGELLVDYSNYDRFDNQFGHLAYDKPLGFVAIRFKYKFFGDQCVGGEAWAYKNSGLMVLGESPNDMFKDQDFPQSIELQLLGARSDQDIRPTANVCTPGTHISFNDQVDTRHCINSNSPSFADDQWIEIEIHINPDNSIDHFVNGVWVMGYELPIIGGDMVNPPKIESKDGSLIEQGYIYLQSESHPVAFKDIEVLSINR